MIKKLTSAQREKFTEYVEKWKAIGLATQAKPMDQERVREIIAEVYKIGGLEPPTEVVFCRSPRECLRERKARAAMSETLDLHEEVRNFIYGQHDAALLAFYDFFRNECNLVKETDPIQPLTRLAYHTNWCLPYETVCFVSERPVAIHMKKDRLHSAEGPALEYGDGFAVWALNGVRMNGVEHLMLPNADPKAILNVKNAEQRAELIKLYGIEKLFWELNPKLLDKEDGYELYTVPVYEAIPRVYLKMQNPSVDEIHIEPVDPKCYTVKEALAWRNTGKVDVPYVKPIVLT